MRIDLKSHEKISSNESIIETIIIKGKKPLKKQRKIFIYFIILFVLISIILFIFFLIYKKNHKNTLNIFNNITSSDLIIENKTQTHEHIINKAGSIIMNNDNMSDIINHHNIDSDIFIDKNTDKNIIKNTSIYPWEKEKLIIHALGEYNQTKYTNSLEALNYWYFKENMTVLEVDFYLTKDNHIILAHDFKHSKRIPTLDEFKNKMRTRGNLTTMTFEDLVIFMEKNKNLYIITDTKYTDLRSIKIEFDEMTKILKIIKV